jgi:hypothetical protein
MSARDWTLEESAPDAAAVRGIQRRCVQLAAPDAIHPCNQSIPLTMVWHEDHQDTEFMNSALPCGNCDQAIHEHHQDVSMGPHKRLPVVIWLHATRGNTQSMMPRLMKYAEMGFLAVAIDCR